MKGLTHIGLADPISGHQKNMQFPKIQINILPIQYSTISHSPISPILNYNFTSLSQYWLLMSSLNLHLIKFFCTYKTKESCFSKQYCIFTPLFKESWKRVFLRWIFSMVIKLSVEEIWTQFGRNKDRVFWYIGSQPSIIRKVGLGVMWTQLIL